MPSRAKKYLAISLFLLFLLLPLICITYLLCYDNIYKGVSVLEVNLSGMCYDDAVSLIKKSYTTEDKHIIFRYGQSEFQLPAKSINVEFDYDKTARSAFEYGRYGSIFGRIRDILRARFKGETLPVGVSVDKDALRYEMEKNLKDFVADNIHNKIELKGDYISILNGKEGMAINIDMLTESIRKNVSVYNMDEINDVTISMTKPSRITYDVLKAMFETDKKDFVYEMRDGKYYYEPSVTGIRIDKDATEKLLKENKTNSEEYAIPVRTELPQKSLIFFSQNYIIDKLSSFNTVFNPSNHARSENIRLAADKINGTLLEPGGEFSFNKVVGKRDEQSGFKTAKVYQSGEVVDGVGGGICQVSSTLFNAVLMADMDIVKRTNHSMPVSYVDLGRDATVSYDYIDFVFRNNKSYPVRIDCITQNGNITCSVMGINEDNKTVEITTEIIKKIPFNTKTVKSPSLYEGKSNVLKAGQEGVRVNTYKTVSINGVKSERRWVCESYYAPVDAIVEVGTKKKPLPQAPSPDVTKPDDKEKADVEPLPKKLVQYPLPES